MAANVFICGAERQALTDYFTIVPAGVSRSAGIFRSGAAAIQCTATVLQSTAAIYSLPQPAVDHQTYFRMGAVFYLRINAIPQVALTIFNNGSGKALRLSTGGTLSYGSQVGTTILLINQWHKVEIIHDVGWAAANGIAMFRLNGVIEGAPDTAGVQLFDRFQFGDIPVKGQTDHAHILFFFDDIYIWYSDEQGNTAGFQPRRAPWINDKVCEVEPDAIGIPHASRVPVAVGTLNDFTGSPEAVNKHLNVDEDPANGDTDYNSAGAVAANKRQTFTFTPRAAYPDAIRGFSVHTRQSLSAANAEAAYNYLLDSDGNVYERVLTDDANTAGANAYFPTHIGYPTKLNGDVLDAAYLNALEAGNSIRNAAASMRQTACFLAVATGAAFTSNDIAFHDVERVQASSV